MALLAVSTSQPCFSSEILENRSSLLASSGEQHTYLSLEELLEFLQTKGLHVDEHVLRSSYNEACARWEKNQMRLDLNRTFLQINEDDEFPYICTELAQYGDQMRCSILRLLHVVSGHSPQLFRDDDDPIENAFEILGSGVLVNRSRARNSVIDGCRRAGLLCLSEKDNIVLRWIGSSHWEQEQAFVIRDATEYDGRIDKSTGRIWNTVVDDLSYPMIPKGPRIGGQIQSSLDAVYVLLGARLDDVVVRERLDGYRQRFGEALQSAGLRHIPVHVNETIVSEDLEVQWHHLETMHFS